MNMKAVFSIHRKDKWIWLYIPLIILFSSFIVNLIVSLLINNDEKFYTGGVISIFAYVLTLGMIVVAQSFPFAIGMSVTRKDYFWGTALMGLTANFIIALFMSMFASLENMLNGWGNRFHFFHFPYLNEGIFMEQLVMYTILFTFLFFIGFLITSFAKRFGGKGLLLLLLSLLLASSIAVFLSHHFRLWSDIFHWFLSQTAAGVSYWLLPLILFSMASSFFLLRKAPV